MQDSFDFSGKTIVVAGSARGIGLELVRQLSDLPATKVLAIDRYASGDIEALANSCDNITTALADVTDTNAVEEAARHVETIDCLLCVSGILGDPKPLLTRSPTDHDASDDLLRVFTVNVQGTFNVVRAFQHKLQPGGKIMLMSSTMASMETATHALNPAYSVSKAGLNMLGRKLAVELSERQIDVVLMSPGVVRTDMNNGQGDIEPSESVAGILREISKPGVSGRFLRYDGKGWPW